MMQGHSQTLRLSHAHIVKFQIIKRSSSQALDFSKFQNLKVWAFERQMMLLFYTGQHLVATWRSGAALATTWRPPGVLALRWPRLGDHRVLCCYTGQHFVNTWCSGVTLATIWWHIIFKLSSVERVLRIPSREKFKHWQFESLKY